MAAKPGLRLSPNFESALQFATQKHDGQYRKGNRAPYISHPMAVSSLVLEMGGSEEQAIAALLHDVIEDCGVSREEIEARFGEAIANIVVACTEKLEKKEHPWRTRKQDYLAQLETISVEASLVVLCDKFHNLTSLEQDIRHRGEKAWIIFTAPADDIRWYYRELSQFFARRPEFSQDRLASMLKEFTSLVEFIQK